jgi:oligo-1,6-glucosidase
MAFTLYVQSKSTGATSCPPTSGRILLTLDTGLKSPQVDMGYDISDYRVVHEPYGTVEDIETLIAELKKHNIKLLMDLVVNHTSNEHPWFLESASSTDNPKRDWYLWQKGKTGPDGEKLPPNNWESLFKGSAWSYDEKTDEYYFHLFAEAQPCLNWKNDKVRAAIHADMHFWLDKGLGGFRMDAINLISKPDDLSDAPVKHQGYYQSCFELVKNRPQVHEWLRELKEKVMDRYDGLVKIGECGGTDEIEEVLRYISPERNELDVIFQFELTEIDKGPTGMFSPQEWQLSDVKHLTKKWQTVLRPGWNIFHLENHDGELIVDRL